MKLLIALLASTLTGGCSSAQVLAPVKAQEKIYVFESDGNGFKTKTIFFDNGEEVVAFDTQFTPKAAEEAIAFLRTQTPNPITFAVVTHPNPDKFNGMGVFQSHGARIVASKATIENMAGVHDYKKFYFVNIAKMFNESSYPILSQADIIFDKHYTLKLRNGKVVELSELAQPGVSTNQTVASIPSQNALVVGDLVHHQAHAWLEGGIVAGKPVPTLGGWIKGLQEISRTFKTRNPIVYGGRGESAALNDAVPAQIQYLIAAEKIVAQYVAALGARKTELLGDRAGEHHQLIQQKFEKKFPTYKLGYMIQYGVYGLVNLKAN